MNNSNHLKYTFAATITSYDTDASGNAGLANLFYLFQEAANHHATALDWGMEYLDSIQKFWVLSRLKIHIIKYPVHKDQIAITTWSRGAEGFFAWRDYQVKLADTVCINATSSWLILDKNTHRPVKIDQIERKIPAINENYLLFPEHKMPAMALTNKIFEKQVNYSDIDINQHVNNGKYVEIIVDALAPKIMSGAVMAELDIQYLFESQINDIIAVYCDEIDATHTNLTLVNTTKGKETCKCSVKWDFVR
ncbi:MAG TPA: acyl-ACP thioesterase domain-containing protein [Bacteroidales bacterium]|nr:acyl-ACP thioesterase domain-containing protein [Bacteroidales bacterium]